MRRPKDLIGLKFGKLLVIKRKEPYISPGGFKQQKWLCKCECGKEVCVIQSALTTGATKSCGCFWEENIKNIQSQATNSYRFKGTKISHLTPKVPLNNSSGHKGVYWDGENKKMESIDLL